MSLLKKIAPLIAAGVLTFANSALAQEVVEKEIKKAPNLIGSSYGEFSFTGGDIADENPKFLNLSVGENFLRKENRDEVLLFPNLRLRLKGDKIENPWNNKVEIALGIEYIKGPFSAGVDGGYLKGFYGLDKEGAFARIWSYYWNKWDLKSFSESKIFPIRPQIIVSNDLEATTLTGCFEDNARLEGGMVFFEKDNLRILAYTAVNANGNTNNFAWTNYLRGTGGLRLERDPFFFFIEGGYQKSWNGGNSGSIFFGGASIYLSINK